MKHVVWEYLHPNNETDMDAMSNNINEGFSVERETPMDITGLSSMVFTPLGTYHEKDPMNPNNHFKFWIGHTNFRLTSDDIDSIKFADGVDLFQVWTPYRFFVSPAKSFEWSIVRQNIEKQLLHANNFLAPVQDEITIETFKLSKDNTLSVTTEIQNFCSTLDTYYKYWVLYTEDKDGDVLCTYFACNSDDSKDFKDTVETVNDTYDVQQISDSIKNSVYYNSESSI